MDPWAAYSLLSQKPGMFALLTEPFHITKDFKLYHFVATGAKTDTKHDFIHKHTMDPGGHFC